MITSHTQLLNALIEKYGLKSYLEIGVQNPANNFDKIVVKDKIGVDPEIKECSGVSDYMTGERKSYQLFRKTSDEFFNKQWPETLPSFDLIFIDGLHHADQVKRDFENSLRCLSDNGFIVIHDVLPENEAGTIVPRETKQWWGDVWKFAFTVVDYRLHFITYDIDNGCMVIQNKPIGWNADEFVKLPTPLPEILDWNYYTNNKQRRLRITTTVEI